MERQTAHLLPIPYFHIVFTLPHEFNPLIQYNQQVLYDLLFSSASQTLQEFGKNDLKANLGLTAVLHTWSQTLLDHYHLHCIVTGGGPSEDGKTWVSVRDYWLFPVRALSVVFRAKFRDGLRNLFAAGKLIFPASQQNLFAPAVFSAWLQKTCSQSWVVYAKRPFSGPKAVLAYLCRYTHRVGITNGRLENYAPQAQTVTFRYKDYADGGKTKSMTLDQSEFLRRFCLHILPPRFVKIRHYGLLSNRDRDQRIGQARKLLAGIAAPGELALPARQEVRPTREVPPQVCPRCRKPSLVLISIFFGPSKRDSPPIDTS